jgi:phospholipase C
MSYLERSDLPYYYALADAFTIGDQHFQSTFTQTDPNRVHLFSGANNNLWNKVERCKGAVNNATDFMMVRPPFTLWVGIAAPSDLPLPCGMQMDNGEPNPGLNWPTFAETLEEAGVSWKVLCPSSKGLNGLRRQLRRATGKSRIFAGVPRGRQL